MNILSFVGSIETKEHLRPVAFKDQETNADHWAKRRKLFKESKQWSSAGGSSVTSDITEESGLVFCYFICSYNHVLTSYDPLTAVVQFRENQVSSV